MRMFGKLASSIVTRARSGLLVSAYSSLLLGQQAGNHATAATSQPPSPPWTRDLVIYEIAPKSFTSPNGPESGTFESLTAKLPYLQDLGITGMWLAGYALSDPRHFFNIWMCYASIEPDKIDSSLGTPEQFRTLIDEAHSHGIKIFLDVTTHRLMKASPAVTEHLEWFRGGTWGMVDFDWNGGHFDLDDWWVKVWSDYVFTYGVDGFRLDLEAYRFDLWERVRRNAAAAGHPIVIFEENVARRYGDNAGLVTDKAQGGAKAKDVPEADGIPDVQLTVAKVADKAVQGVTLSDDGGNIWNFAGPLWTGRPLGMEGNAPDIRLHLSTNSYGSSIALSIHDIGFGRNARENTYTARGSRALDVPRLIWSEGPRQRQYALWIDA